MRVPDRNISRYLNIIQIPPLTHTKEVNDMRLTHVFARRRSGQRVIRAFTASLRVIGMELSSDNDLPPEGGVPIFWAYNQRKMYGFHPWRAMQERYIQTTSAIMTGGKNMGKTASALLLMFVTGMLDMGNGNRARMIYDNMRTNDNVENEDEELLRVYGKDGVRIKVREAKINPYDYRLGLSPSQMLRWTIAMIHDLSDATFDEFEINILGQLIRRMVNETRDATAGVTLACPSLLVQMAEEFETQDYIDNIKVGRHNLLKMLGRKNKASKIILGNVLKSEDSWESRIAIAQHPELVTLAAARLAAKLRANLLEGNAGEIFGDEGSLAEMMGDYLYVSQDLTGLDDALASAYHYLSRLYITAANRFDIIVQDETSKSWRFTSWAAAEHDEEWQIRETSPFKIRLIQELSLLETSADANTRQYHMAMNSFKGAGIHFIFGGQSEAAYRFLGEILQISALDIKWLIDRKVTDAGAFGLKPRYGAFVKSQTTIMTDFEKKLISSNRAVRRRLGRRSSQLAA